MRQAFAHEAVLSMDPGADAQAPGAAITVALCGHWEHEPPCPLAPHHCRAERVGDEVRLRILFATDPSVEPEVRRRIGAALADGVLTGPSNEVTRWSLLRSGADEVQTAETDHADRLCRS